MARCDCTGIISEKVTHGFQPGFVNLSVPMAHNLVRKAPGKDSLRLRRKTAAWGDEFLLSLIAA